MADIYRQVEERAEEWCFGRATLPIEQLAARDGSQTQTHKGAWIEFVFSNGNGLDVRLRALKMVSGPTVLQRRDSGAAVVGILDDNGQIIEILKKAGDEVEIDLGSEGLTDDNIAERLMLRSRDV